MGRWGDGGVWGVWGERGERFLPHPPTPPTPPTPPACPMPFYDVNCEPRIIVPIPTSVKISKSRAWGIRPSMMCAARTP